MKDINELRKEFMDIEYIKEFYTIAKEQNRELSSIEQGFLMGAWWMYKELKK